MKKVSTTAVKQSGNFSQPNLTIGLDLGDRSSYYCVLGESGELGLEQKISTTAKALQAAFGAMPGSQRVRMEGWRQWQLGLGRNNVTNQNQEEPT